MFYTFHPLIFLQVFPFPSDIFLSFISFLVFRLCCSCLSFPVSSVRLLPLLFPFPSDDHLFSKALFLPFLIYPFPFFSYTVVVLARQIGSLFSSYLFSVSLLFIFISTRSFLSHIEFRCSIFFFLSSFLDFKCVAETDPKLNFQQDFLGDFDAD